MLNRIYITCSLLVFVAGLNAQQLNNGTVLSDRSDIISNPAITAADRQTIITAAYQQQWTGFTDAPATAFATGQFAFKNTPVSIGVFVETDRFLPFNRQTLGMSYAYSLGGYDRDEKSNKRSFSTKRKHGQLSLGIAAAVQQLTYDTESVIANAVTDQLLNESATNALSPTVSFGLYYLSSTSGPKERSYGSAGLALQQLLNFGTLTTGFKRVTHGSMSLAYHHEGEHFIIEPRLRLDFTAKSPSHARFTILTERIAAYWAGLTYDTNKSISLQAGYILSSEKEGQQTRIGVSGTFNISSAVSTRGLGYAAYVAYRFGS